MFLLNNESRWGIISKLFHWMSALMIFSLLYVGLTMTALPDSADKWEMYASHKSAGIVLLGLTLLRILWRFSQKTPAALSAPGVFQILSKLSVPVLYLSLLTMIFSGIVMSNAGGYPINVFNLFIFPDFIGKNIAIAQAANTVHKTMAWIIIGLIVLHTLAALYHQFILKDNLLKRMLFGKIG